MNISDGNYGEDERHAKRQDAMTTPNNQPTPPPGMEILTDYTKPLPKGTLYEIENGTWVPSRWVGYIPLRECTYAVPITVPATGDTNEKGGEQRQELLPCPFCGPDYPRFSERAPGNSPWTEDYGYWKTGCAQCGIEFHGADQEEAEERWNTRK